MYTYSIYDNQSKEYEKRKAEKKEVIEKAFKLISDKVKSHEGEYSEELKKIISKESESMGITEAVKVLSDWGYSVSINKNL